MRYTEIYKFDISNGPGIRVSLFVQGCDKHCPGCFNSETWDFHGGKVYDHKINNYLMSLCNHKYVSGLSILGGEPLNPKNVTTIIDICNQFKHLFPDKNIWLWTGYTFEELKRNQDFQQLIKYIDVVVDGPFIESQKNLSLKWRGSKNQHIWKRGEKMSENSNMWYCVE